MALKDLVFGLSIKADKFDAGMKKAQAELRKLSAMRLDGLRKEMKALQGATDKVSKTRFRALVGEMKTLQGAMKATERQADKTKKSIGGIGNIFQGVGQGIGQGIFGTLMRGIRGAGGLITDALKSGVEGNQIDAALANALKQSGSNPAWLEPLQKQADRVRRTFNFDDEDVKQGFTSLLTGGMAPDQVIKQATLMADIAAKNKISVAESGKIIASVYNGETRALKQLKVFITETNDKRINAMRGMKALIDTQSGFAAANAGADAPWVRLASAWDEMKQAIGQRLLPVIAPMLQSLGDLLNTFIDTNEFKAMVDSFGETIRYAVNWITSFAKGFDFNKVGASILDIFRRVSELMTELIVHAAGLAGDAFMEKMPAIFGGGKKDGKNVFQRTKESLGVSDKKLQGELWKADSEAHDSPVSSAIKKFIINKSLSDKAKPTFGSIFDKHYSNMQQAAGGGNAYLSGLISQATATASADRAALAADAGNNPGYSKRAEAIERAEAAKKSKSFVKQRNMKIQFSSMDSNVHPIAGLA